MKNLSFALLTLVTLTPGFVRAQPVTPPAAAAAGETTLQLDVGFGVRAVPAARVTVPAGETLRLVAPDLGRDIAYIWTRNGRAIPGATERTLVLPRVASSDAGTYACLFSTPATLPQTSQQLVLGVGPTDRLLNLSTRGLVTADQSLIAGFAVSATGQGKKLILRAVGPSLSLFGVGNPLRQPVLQLFDASGRSYQNGYAYPPVVGGPTYESDLADSLARSGAFPLPAGTRDVVMMLPFVPGNYTAQVTSGDGTPGTVLLEIYEVP
ncbi:MAG: hypothetical protein JNL92_06230 [Opitutaceae bacterium]|nr:hypothetical protein [Opitutaceae bacterium]